MKPPLVLGISALYHDSAAVLLSGSRILAAAQEERFTRKKADEDFPVNAIAYVLGEAGIIPDDLDAVAFYEKPELKLERLVSSYPAFGAAALPTFLRGLSGWLTNKFDVSALIRKELDTKTVPTYVVDHHMSHAASAFYPSPFKSAAILTIDGVGEWATTTISAGSGKYINPVKQVEYPDSLGMLYSSFTAFCGFKVNSGEYKLMGLAPYGSPRYVNQILDEVLWLRDDGSFSLNPMFFSYSSKESSFSHRFEELFGVPPRSPEADLTQVHADIAASIQAVTNQAVISLAKSAKSVTGQNNLCLAGGVALNVVSMGALEREEIFDSTWVQPAAGDSGGALGAAFFVSLNKLGQNRELDESDLMGGAFLGPSPDSFRVSSSQALDAENLFGVLKSDEDLALAVATRLSQGKIVAIARGRMEFGPRALGARSILAPATDRNMQSKLNLKIKFRESFRPFAPMVLEEDFDGYFDGGPNVVSPYMLKTFYVKELRRLEKLNDRERFGVQMINQARSDIPAVTHLDYSARVQTIDTKRNPFLHQVLSHYKKLTGFSVIVNTSFNVRGEPIVASASDAVRCFLLTEIDDLVVGNFYVRRDEQTRQMPSASQIREFLEGFDLD